MVQPKALAVPIIVVLNVIVYIMWTLQMLNQPSFMVDNFLVSWQAVTEGRVWVLISSVFSHNNLLHIAFNMIALRSFGTIIEQVIGTWRFIKFYFIAGVISSLCHCLVSAYIIGSPDIAALGASGSISGLILLFALLFPKERLAIFGLIPIPALFGAILFVGLDIWGLAAQAHGGGLPIGHGAHLGGAVTGFIYYLMLKKDMRSRLSDAYIQD